MKPEVYEMAILEENETMRGSVEKSMLASGSQTLKRRAQ